MIVDIRALWPGRVIFKAKALKKDYIIALALTTIQGEIAFE